MSFHNDGQFPVSHKSLAGILSQYGIEDFAYSVATSGIENTTCIIEVSNKQYALRIYRQAKKCIAKTISSKFKGILENTMYTLIEVTLYVIAISLMDVGNLSA